LQLAEGALMEWYYRSKADGTKHGIADEKTLAEMAQNGELKPVDLVWSEQTGGRWVQAQTVEGLFSKAGSSVSVTAQTPQKVLNDFEASKPPVRRRRSPFLRMLLLLAVAAAGWAAFLLLQAPSTTPVAPPSSPSQPSQNGQPKLSSSAQPIPGQTSQPPSSAESISNAEQEVINSNKIASLTAQFNTVMSNEDLDAASRLIVDIAKSSEETLKVQALSRRMIVLRQTLTRCAQLEELLRAGKMEPATAKEMVALYDSRKKRGDVVNMAKAMLADSESMTSDACLSMARVCMALDDSAQTKAALDNYVAHVKINRDKLNEYLEVARLLYVQSDPLRSAELMRKYLLMEPSNPDIWLEYAAWKCVGGDPDAAIYALEQAIKCGDRTTKQKAQEDRRFVSLKDKWAFRHLVKIRPAAEY
jgi:hypothetical protein